MPKTAEYEARMDGLRKEYQEFVSFSESKELSDYLDLEKTILSSDFALKKKQILQQKYSDTPEYRQEKEFLTLKKSKSVRLYYKAKESVALKEYKATEDSDTLARYYELEKFVQSPEFFKAKGTMGKRFSESEEYKKLMEFKQLKKADMIRRYFAYGKSKINANYKALDGTDTIARYEELEKTVASDDFRKVKEYMLLPGKKKYELSEEFKMEQDYYSRKNSEKFTWYFKVKDSNIFDEVKRWNLTFTEEFSDGIDKKKWLRRYFWGEAVLKDTYALNHEKHVFTDGNLEVAHGVLKIITKKESVKAKAWDPKLGFFPKEFNYTSGLLSSGNNFRQQYGLFEAKIRLNKSYPVNHAFWMVSDQMLPHIDVVKYAKKVNFGNYWNRNGQSVQKKHAATGAGKYTGDFFIYSLEWSKQKLIWKINGITVMVSEEGIPEAPMYLNFSSGLYREANGSVLPASMEIDWIRCYQHT
ncbi:MAG: glycoside hydrolase family 16 protein [Bacteroidales bacterium]|nr:glycoside hydrolase family 16 protein [Bacteroidales bacterium]